MGKEILNIQSSASGAVDLHDEDLCVTSAVDLFGIFTQTWERDVNLHLQVSTFVI